MFQNFIIILASLFRAFFSLSYHSSAYLQHELICALCPFLLLFCTDRTGDLGTNVSPLKWVFRFMTISVLKEDNLGSADYLETFMSLFKVERDVEFNSHFGKTIMF